MNDKIQQLIKLQKLLVTLGEVERADFWPGTRRKQNESSVEHSYFLATLSWQVAAVLDLKLNHEKILKYCLVHDLPEAYAGDTPLMSDPERRQAQNQLEKDATAQIVREFPDTDISNMLQEFQEQADPESKFVQAMDGLIALFVHITSQETQFMKNEITRKHIEDVLPKWRQKTDVSSEMIELTDALLDVWYRTVKLHVK